MNYGQFKALVRDFIPLDSIRANSGTFIDRLIKSASLQLVSFIPGYDSPAEVRFVKADAITVGNAHLVTLPSGSELLHALIAYRYADDVTVEGDSNDPAARDYKHRPLAIYPDWTDRFHVINSDSGNTAAYDPVTNRLFFTPLLEDNSDLVVNVRLRATDWADPDEVPFNHADAECVSHFVAAGVARHIEKNLKLHEEEMKLYRATRRLRHVEQKQNPSAVRYLTPSAPSGTNPVALDSLAELRAVATLAGAIRVGTVLVVVTAGFATLWKLSVGSTADDDNLVVRPADYSAGYPLNWARVTAAITP